MDNIFFDPREEVIIRSSGHLPHRHQDEKMQFITFRLGDSLPQSLCQELYQRKSLFLQNNPEPWDSTTKLKYYKEIDPIQQQMLDNGYGACYLKHSICRQVLIDAIAFRDDINYITDAYVIMPNHVHILIIPLGTNKIEDIIGSIKQFSANKINRIVGRKGPLWMKESFDRIVRSEDNYKHYYNYIISNPYFLPKSDYTLYLRYGGEASQPPH